MITTYQPVINGCYGLLPPVAQRHLAALPSSTLISSVAAAKSFTMCTFLFIFFGDSEREGRETLEKCWEIGPRKLEKCWI
jgi:hypothetical protein